jgi:hypothetical protein
MPVVKVKAFKRKGRVVKAHNRETALRFGAKTIIGWGKHSYTPGAGSHLKHIKSVKAEERSVISENDLHNILYDHATFTKRFSPDAAIRYAESNTRSNTGVRRLNKATKQHIRKYVSHKYGDIHGDVNY